jgi:succinate-acetate transporter protein
MSGRQSKKVGKKQANPGKIALIGAGATALAVVNIMTNGAEAPSQGVMILQYAALAGGLLALVGGLIMMAMAPKD